MIYLSQLTPAEVAFLTKDKVTLQEFLKITFIHLLLKQVLKTFEVERQAHVNHKVRIYNYVGVGEHFNNYISHNHEKFFLATFEYDPSIEMLFRNLVKVAYQKSKTVAHFKNELIKTPTLKKCYSQNIFQKIFNCYSTTAYGKELKRKVQQEIQHLNSELSSVKNIENQKAIEIIKVIGGNIFLLENINYDLLEQIDADLAQEMNRKSTNTDGSGCSGCGWSFDNYSTDFDSGCSSTSGCGGASGCGGCGGCGGD